MKINFANDRDGDHKSTPANANLFFLENLDQIDCSIRKADELGPMMESVLDRVLSIFSSDRAWLIFPGDPLATSWEVSTERTRKGIPAAMQDGGDMPMNQDINEAFQLALDCNHPIACGPESQLQLTSRIAEQFNICSQMIVAIHPRLGSPWLLGMHRCTHSRIWRDDEQELFHEIGKRIADALGTLLMLQESRKSEEKYRALVENSPDLIYRTDMKGSLTFVSASILNLTGYTVEEAIGQKLAEKIYVEPADRDLFAKMIKKNGFVENFESRLKHKNGSIWWACTSAHLLKDTKGNFLGVEGVTRNISKKKKVQLALSKSETYLRTLLNAIPDLIWLKDEHGVYLDCNHRFERFFGATESEICGKTDYDFVSTEQADLFREHDMLALAHGKPIKNEEEITYADDGHLEILETIKTPMYASDGQLMGVLGIARDITQRKNLESQLRQSQKMEEIGTIASGISHDFNNILGVILGNVELAIHSHSVSGPVQKNLEKIKKASLLATDIVRQLLKFTRKTEKVLVLGDILPIVKDSTKLLRSFISNSVDIQLNTPKQLPSIVADPTQIYQLLINLCTNAAHAMETDGGTLTIDLFEVELDTVTVTQYQKIVPFGHYLQLMISDTGCGIDSTTKEKIFDSYFTTKEVGKGTGMGLAIALSIVENHNGAILVDSEPEKGSVFRVLLPIIQRDTVARSPVLTCTH